MLSSEFSLRKSSIFKSMIDTGRFDAAVELSKDPQVDVNWKDEYGYSALASACSNSNPKAVKLLLGLDGINPNVETYSGKTPFHVACSRSTVKVVSILLADERVDINEPCSYNRTPLCKAVNRNNYFTIKVLIASGRPIDTKTVPHYSGPETTSMAELARKTGHPHIAELLERYDQNPSETVLAMRKQLGFQDKDIGKLFALAVYFSDGYLRPREKAVPEEVHRFFRIVSRLPLEIQMLLCHRVFGSMGTIVKTKHSEPAFREYAKEEE